MFRASVLLARLENRIEALLGGFFEKHGQKMARLAPVAIIGWYFYGMLINSVRLGIKTTFNTDGAPPGGIWVANPFWNFLAPFTPEGLGITAVCILLICLITKKGYIWFSGYKYTRDPRGFDILPDATHGSSGFMTRKEMGAVLDISGMENADGAILGKIGGDSGNTGNYASLKESSGIDNHTIVFGATGSGKSRGYVRPFIYQAVKRRESIILVDPKAELYESTSDYVRAQGYGVRVFNLLDPQHSDGWNPLNDIEFDQTLVDSIAEVIIKNTSNVSERQDFWEKAEKNLLQALMHYVQRQRIPGTDRLLPIEQRSFGAIYRLLSDESFGDLESRFDSLPKDHPAKAPYGIFKLAHRQIWGNIAIGLGNRLSIFQNPLVDQITSRSDIDMTMPGRQPCVYYCVISAQDSRYEFLSSLFFSCIAARLIDFARREGENGRLPVRVNLLLEEFCNIGNLGVDFLKQLAILRGFNIHCQMLAQSIPQLMSRYPKSEWEEVISHCDCMICLGANDLKTADYLSDKCGKVTIRVDNNQMPLMPLFSPIYNSTRPYSQTRSSTQRALMMPDEILRMSNEKALIMLRGQKPLLLDKISPEEFPAYNGRKTVHISDYLPPWSEDAPNGRVCNEQSPTSQIKPETVMPQASAAQTQPETKSPDARVPQNDILTEKERDAHSRPAWYPDADYSLSEDALSESSEKPHGKYGALKPMETTLQTVRDSATGFIHEQECKREE